MIYEFEYLTQAPVGRDSKCSDYPSRVSVPQQLRVPGAPGLASQCRSECARKFLRATSSQHPFKLAGFLIVSSRLL